MHDTMETLHRLEKIFHAQEDRAVTSKPAL